MPRQLSQDQVLDLLAFLKCNGERARTAEKK